MKYLLNLLLLFFSAGIIYGQPSPAQSADAFMDKMFAANRNGLKKMQKGTFQYSNTCFNIADYYALHNKKDSAFLFLNEALNTCPYTSPACKETYLPDVLGSYPFEKWMKTTEWKTFEKRITESYFAVNSDLKNPQLAYDIMKRRGWDQSIRYYVKAVKPESVAKSDFRRIDSTNLAFIKQVVLTHGFPKISMVGDKAAHTAFLLCQHAGKDLAFQKKILEQMERYLPQGEVNKGDYAYLYDRIMVKEKGMQRYGTQFNGRHTFFPIEDSVNVDKRRKEMGLSTLEEYNKSVVYFDEK